MNLTLIIVLFFVVVIVAVLIVIVLRLRNQRVSMHDGQLVVSKMGERESAIPTTDIGTVLYVPENDGGDARYKMGVFDYGGLIILNNAGKLVRVIRHYAGSTLALRPIFEQIPAPSKIEFAGRQRRDLVKLYPHALGYFQLRGQMFWVVFPCATFFALIVAVPVVAFIVILIKTLMGLD